MIKRQGAALYYASDKNIFDALTNRRVSNSTLSALFSSRNTIVSTSSQTDREELAKYFSRLTHDYFDHKDIAVNLGAVPRRENISSTEIHEKFEFDQLKLAIEDLKQELEDDGEIVRLIINNEDISINIQYTEFDYKLAEFSQMKVRDGEINFIKNDAVYLIRNTQNLHINNIRRNLLTKLSNKIGKEIDTVDISLFDITDPQLRSSFFYRLISDDEEFIRQDVSKAFVYKAIPEEKESFDDNELTEDFQNEVLAHIESVALKGRSVTQSDLLNGLLRGQNYHIFKINWTFKEILNDGSAYEVEAMFGNPKDCVEFSFIIKAVYVRDKMGNLSNKRRVPTMNETDRISSVIEKKARNAMDDIRSSLSVPTSLKDKNEE